ncbi:hypothetical protein [Streptomyces silvisoli]|uniref:Uncharacterized protein n=1 Tax=Streptomyces silvisoli TaxID=3034235 RepID=A0ABT5ZI29_9ACTN|nr:hypothetical protein [Streptomyces silvisoli]MDF3289488.1 hypothetical protein [Streptomyces silvisoli]
MTMFGDASRHSWEAFYGLPSSAAVRPRPDKGMDDMRRSIALAIAATVSATLGGERLWIVRW